MRTCRSRGSFYSVGREMTVFWRGKWTFVIFWIGTIILSVYRLKFRRWFAFLLFFREYLILCLRLSYLSGYRRRHSIWDIIGSRNFKASLSINLLILDWMIHLLKKIRLLEKLLNNKSSQIQLNSYRMAAVRIYIGLILTLWWKILSCGWKIKRNYGDSVRVRILTRFNVRMT